MSPTARRELSPEQPAEKRTANQQTADNSRALQDGGGQGRLLGNNRRVVRGNLGECVRCLLAKHSLRNLITAKLTSRALLALLSSRTDSPVLRRESIAVWKDYPTLNAGITTTTTTTTIITKQRGYCSNSRLCNHALSLSVCLSVCLCVTVYERVSVCFICSVRGFCV